MSKPTIKFKKLHDDLTDCVEYIATYGTGNVNAEELNYLIKISHLAEEYIRIMEEEANDVYEDEGDLFDDEEEQ